MGLLHGIGRVINPKSKLRKLLLMFEFVSTFCNLILASFRYMLIENQQFVDSGIVFILGQFQFCRNSEWNFLEIRPRPRRHSCVFSIASNGIFDLPPGELLKYFEGNRRSEYLCKYIKFSRCSEYRMACMHPLYTLLSESIMQRIKRHVNNLTSMFAGL